MYGNLFNNTTHIPTQWLFLVMLLIMQNIALQGKTNFFEKRVGEYANKANPNKDLETQEFSMEADF